MSIRINSITTEKVVHSEEDFNKMNDRDFCHIKASHPLSILVKAIVLSEMILKEDQKIKSIIEEIERRGPSEFIQNSPNSITFSLPPFVDETSRNALRFSVLMIQFTYIESLCNTISDIAIRLNTDKNLLSEYDIEFLTEVKTLIKDGEIQSKSSFKKITDKVKKYPKLLAKVCEDQFALDYSNDNWQKFLDCKEIRDDITHPKKIQITEIESKVLFEMSEFIFWYSLQVYKLLKDNLETNWTGRLSHFAYALLLRTNIHNGGDVELIKEQQEIAIQLNPNQNKK